MERDSPAGTAVHGARRALAPAQQSHYGNGQSGGNRPLARLQRSNAGKLLLKEKQNLLGGAEAPGNFSSKRTRPVRKATELASGGGLPGGGQCRREPFGVSGGTLANSGRPSSA